MTAISDHDNLDNDIAVHSGALSYDADGAGGHAAIHFATLVGHPALTAADFLVG
jgi:Ca2+-binding RTX toxin-like protein